MKNYFKISFILLLIFVFSIGILAETEENEEEINFIELVQEATPTEVEKAINEGADINQKSEFIENTPLIEAAFHNDDIKVIQILLENGAEINEENDLGRTALMYAVQSQDDVEYIKKLLEHGARVNKEDQSGATALLWAVRNENEDIVKLLLDKGAKVNKTTDFGRNVLSYAAEYNPNIEIIKLLIEEGANPNNRDRDKDYNPLMWAVSFNPNPEVLDFLVEQGLDIKAKTDREETLLMVAAANNTSPEVIEYIIEQGIEIKEVDRWGWTTLMHALAENDNSEDIVKTLIEHEAELERMTEEPGSKRNILGFAAQHNDNPEVFKIMFENMNKEYLKKAINHQDSQGRTPLITAAYYEKLNIIPILLKYGADKTIKDYDDNTALDYLEEKNKELKQTEAYEKAYETLTNTEEVIDKINF